MVVNACNPSYTGGGNQKDLGLRLEARLNKKLARLHLN
jgi:hypothetical protein